MSGAKNRLTGVRPIEVSLVDRAAIRRQFLLTKSESQMNLAESMETVLEKSVTGEDALIAKLEKSATDATQNGLKAIARAIESVKGDLPDEVKAELAKSLGVEKAAPSPDVKTLDQLVKELDDTAKAALVKSLSDDKDAGPDLSKLDDATRAEIEKSNKERDDRIVELEKKETASRDREAKRDAREKSEDITKGIDTIDAADFSEKVVGPIMKSCPEALPEIERIMKSVSEMAEKNTELLKELGSDAPGANTPAGAKLEKAAEEIMKSDTTGLTREQAIVKAIKANPKLGVDYNASLQ